MLILCIGPDTYRAGEKARELEQAFRQKFDLDGTSIERLWPGESSLADQVIERANTISLFTPRRFMRTADLLSSCTKTKQQALAQALSKDPENVIVVSVESEAPSDQAMKIFSALPKCVRYDFPVMNEAAFSTWVKEQAKTLDIQDETGIRFIIEQGNSDTWFASNELMKLAAGGSVERIDRNEQQSMYDIADAFIQGHPDWRKALIHSGEMNAGMSAFLAQIRSFLRVRDQAGQVLPSFITRKMERMKSKEEPEKLLAKVLLFYFVQRSGLGNEEEAIEIL